MQTRRPAQFVNRAQHLPQIRDSRQIDNGKGDGRVDEGKEGPSLQAQSPASDT